MTDKRKRELNAICAKARGWKLVMNEPRKCLCYYNKHNVFVVPKSNWNPTEDPAQAMEMLDWLNKQWLSVHITIEYDDNCKPDKCYVMSDSSFNGPCGEAKTFPLAIAEAVAAEYERMKDEG